MTETTVKMNVRRTSPTTSVIDIEGDVNGFVENELMQAYTEASSPQGGTATRNIVLNFSGLEYMNSSGIGLLVTLLIRVNRQGQRMLAYGLSEHYQHIFELTRLTDAIGIYGTEAEVLAAAQNG